MEYEWKNGQVIKKEGPAWVIETTDNTVPNVAVGGNGSSIQNVSKSYTSPFITKEDHDKLQERITKLEDELNQLRNIILVKDL